MHWSFGLRPRALFRTGIADTSSRDAWRGLGRGSRESSIQHERSARADQANLRDVAGRDRDRFTPGGLAPHARHRHRATLASYQLTPVRGHLVGTGDRDENPGWRAL